MVSEIAIAYLWVNSWKGDRFLENRIEAIALFRN
jgi:hypothetical protein